MQSVSIMAKNSSCEYQCTDGTCIFRSQLCNGIYECLDRNDENAAHCQPVMSSTLESCSNDSYHESVQDVMYTLAFFVLGIPVIWLLERLLTDLLVRNFVEKKPENQEDETAGQG